MRIILRSPQFSTCRSHGVRCVSLTAGKREVPFGSSAWLRLCPSKYHLLLLCRSRRVMLGHSPLLCLSQPLFLCPFFLAFSVCVLWCTCACYNALVEVRVCLCFSVDFGDQSQAMRLCNKPSSVPASLRVSCVLQCPHELPCPQLTASKPLACSFSQAYHPIPFSWVCTLRVITRRIAWGNRMD